MSVPTDVVSPEEFNRAREALLVKEKALTRARDALAAARRYNALAREHGLTPAQLALAFCYTSPRVASTILGVTSVAQLDENLAAWGTTLAPELLQRIDGIRWELRDPAQ